MDDILEAVKVVESLPATALGALIVLSAFGLAAYAIYAVHSATKGRR